MTTIYDEGRAATAVASRQVTYREDGALHLALGPELTTGAAARSIHFHPGRTDADPAARLQELRAHGLPVHGLSPGWLTRHPMLPVDSFSLFTGALSGPAEPAAEGWRDCLDLGLPCVATVTYGPADSEEALRERLSHLHRAQAVVLLPRAIGDRVLRSEGYTDGIHDLRFLATARRVLPPSVRVRASWAALGFKMAQAMLAFGVDELAGWGLEEQLAYGKKGRPAAVVDAAEVRAGIEEAGRGPQEF